MDNINLKKIMILGASYTQTPLYLAAKKIGVQTIAASIPGDYPGFSLADDKVYVDISSPEDIRREAERLHIHGIVTCGLDLGMRALGCTAESLGLTGPSYEAAQKAGNKWEMKKALTEADVPTPRAFCIHNTEELESAMEKLTFPLVVKAADQMGSRGIFRCNTKKDVLENYVKSRESTSLPYVILEEFIQGEMFGVEGMIQDGKILFLLPNNIENYMGGTVPTPVGHSVPYRYEETLGGKIRSIAERAVRALGLDNCPVNLDMIREGDRIYVIELTGRSGATGLSEMVGAWYDIDYYEVLIRLALGEDVSGYFSRNTSNPAVLTHTLMSLRSGRTVKLSRRIPEMEGIIDFSFNVVPGDEIRAYTNGRDRIGQIYVKGHTLEECKRKCFLLENSYMLELEGDLPVTETPIQSLRRSIGDNHLYMKREDLLPYAFGGNKLRFAQAYFADFEIKKKTAMILYGGYSSNLCRIMASACWERGIPCAMVYNTADADQTKVTFNKQLIDSFGVREYPCDSLSIADAVTKAMRDFEEQGLSPYYIHGDCYGKGNVSVPMQSYIRAYLEILKQEKEMNLHFDIIALAGSTNTTQSGLLAAKRLLGDERLILGLSVNRTKQRAEQVISDNLKEFFASSGLQIDDEKDITVSDDGLLGGYGKTSPELQKLIYDFYLEEGIPLDETYTGKAMLSLEHFVEKEQLSGRNILFLHTGGLPMFYDYMGEKRG